MASWAPPLAAALVLAAPAPAAVIHGTEGDDVIHGTPKADVIYGYGGNDVIYPGLGRNVVRAGAGDDVIVSTSRTRLREFIRCGDGYDVQRDLGWAALTILLGCEASW